MLLIFPWLKLGHLNRTVVILYVVVALIVKISNVEHLVVNHLVAVVYLFPHPVAPSVLLIRIQILWLNKLLLTVSMNQDGISSSFISL